VTTLATLQSLIAQGESETVEFKRSTAELKRVAYTSLYAEANPEARIWWSIAWEDFDSRATKDDTLRVLEYVPKGTKLVGEVELPASQLDTLKRLAQEVDALGGGRSTGGGLFVGKPRQ